MHEAQKKKCTPGGVVVAVDTLRASSHKIAETSMEEEKSKAASWVNFQRGLHVFAVHFWHTEGWTCRHEALMEAVLSSVAWKHGARRISTRRIGAPSRSRDHWTDQR